MASCRERRRGSASFCADASVTRLFRRPTPAQSQPRQRSTRQGDAIAPPAATRGRSRRQGRPAAFAQNLLQRVTEDLGVVASDSGEQRQLRLQQPHRIEPAADARLVDDQLRSAAGKQQLRRQRQYVEEPQVAVLQVAAVGQPVDLPQGLRQLRLRARDAIDRHPLPPGGKVRRGVAASPHAGAGEQAGQIGGGAGLAVGADHRDRRRLRMRRQSVAQLHHRPQRLPLPPSRVARSDPADVEAHVHIRFISRWILP